MAGPDPAAPAGPVTDWVHDFDLFDPDFAADPFPVWADLRRSHPVARTGRWGGAVMPTRYHDVTAVLQDTAHFTSRDLRLTGGDERGYQLFAPPYFREQLAERRAEPRDDF